MITKQPPKSQKLQSRLSNFCTVPVMILILMTASCQTTDDTSTMSIKDQTSTSLQVAISYLDSGRPDKARQELQTVLEDFPQNADALNLMGIAHLALRTPSKGLSFLQKSFAISPATATGLNVSSALIELGRYKEAEKVVMALLKRKESPPYRFKERIYHNYGIIAERTNRVNLAEKMYRSAANENPTFHLSRLRLAHLYMERQKTDLALREMEAARFACPTCLEPIELLSRYYAHVGNVKVARSLIRDYKKVDGVILSAQDQQRMRILEEEIATFERTAASKNLQTR